MKKYGLLLFSLLSLIAINSCIKEKPKPVADFSFTGGDCSAPCQVLFENKSTDATSYTWNFGDGTNSVETNPDKTYESGGTYLVTLTAHGAGGADSTSKEIIIANSLPVVEISTLLISISLPENCSSSFTITNSGPRGSIMEYVVADDGVLGGFLKIDNATGSLSSGNSAIISVSVKPEFISGPGGAGGSAFVLNVYTPQATNYIKIPVSVEITTIIGTWSGTWSGISYSTGLPLDAVTSPVFGTWVLDLQSVNTTDGTASGTLTWTGFDKYWTFTYDDSGNVIDATPQQYEVDRTINFDSSNATLVPSAGSCNVVNLTIVGALPNQNIYYGPWFHAHLDSGSNTTIPGGDYDGFATHPSDPTANWVGLSQGIITGNKE